MSSIKIEKPHTFSGHTDSIYSLCKVDHKRFLSAGADGMVILWDLSKPNEGELVVKISGSIYAMEYHEESGILYLGHNNDGVHSINLQNKQELGSIHLGAHQIFTIKIIENTLWVGLQSGEIVILSKDLELLDRFKLTDDRIRDIGRFENAIAIASSDNTIRIKEIGSNADAQQLTGHKNSVFRAIFHPSGKYLATVGRDAHIKIWDTKEDYVLRESIAAHLHTINDLVFSDDGRYFVTASMDKAIKLWDAYNFRLLKVLDKHRHAGHGNSVNKLLWMEYQNLLVSCSDDRFVSVWKLTLKSQ